MFSILTISLFLLSLTLMFLSFLISKKTLNNREKFSPFECGFDFFSYSRMPFSIKFFLIAIIFIIFDVEISIILPLIPAFYKSNILKWFITSIFFLLILFLGLILEWKENSLEWK